MKITTKNYFKEIENLDFKKLPVALKQSHAVILVKTIKGEDWSKYKTDFEFKEMVDLAFRKLEEYSNSKSKKDLSGIRPIKDKRYANIETECMFIDRFLAFHGKVTYKKTFGKYIDDLQEAIDGKRIRKTSPVAKEIMEIQGAAVKQFNTMYNADYFVLKPETIKRFNEIVAKWENTYDTIDESYAKSKKETVTLQGVSETHKVNVVESTDFANLHFNTIGFKERWLAFIGDPAPGFTAMVFGMPKMGKSYLCMDFAGYLARNHGKVLYVAKEEKLDKTLQDKVIEKEVAHPNLKLSDGVPANLAEFDFIFLDSVNKLGLTPKDLEKLKANNKGKSFIYVFQATKSGRFKGNNEFQHDVDVVIEVPEKGKAIQYGRFNQGGETDIFPTETTKESGFSLPLKDKQPTLQGISEGKKMKETNPQIGDIKEIQATVVIPYEIIKMLCFEDDDDVSDSEVEEFVDDQPLKLQNIVDDLCNDELEGSEVRLVEVFRSRREALNEEYFLFTARLKGTEQNLREVADETAVFMYDWSNYEKGMKNSYLKQLKTKEN